MHESSHPLSEWQKENDGNPLTMSGREASVEFILVGIVILVAIVLAIGDLGRYRNNSSYNSDWGSDE